MIFLYVRRPCDSSLHRVIPCASCRDRYGVWLSNYLPPRDQWALLGHRLTLLDREVKRDILHFGSYRLMVVKPEVGPGRARSQTNHEIRYHRDKRDQRP